MHRRSTPGSRLRVPQQERRCRAGRATAREGMTPTVSSWAGRVVLADYRGRVLHPFFSAADCRAQLLNARRKGCAILAIQNNRTDPMQTPQLPGPRSWLLTSKHEHEHAHASTPSPITSATLISIPAGHALTLTFHVPPVAGPSPTQSPSNPLTTPSLLSPSRTPAIAVSYFSAKVARASSRWRPSIALTLSVVGRAEKRVRRRVVRRAWRRV